MKIEQWQFLFILQQHLGRRSGVPVGVLVDEIYDHFSIRTNAREVREITQNMRLDGHHICAHPKDGYFLAITPEELDETLEFLYRRAMASLKQIAHMKRVSLPDLRGQLRLSTT